MLPLSNPDTRKHFRVKDFPLLTLHITIIGFARIFKQKREKKKAIEIKFPSFLRGISFSNNAYKLFHTLFVIHKFFSAKFKRHRNSKKL